MEEKQEKYDHKKDPDFRELMLIIKVILVMSLLMLVGTLISSIFASAQVRTSSIYDINYEFENDNLFTSTDLGQQNWWGGGEDISNIRNRTIYTGEYNATYSFENGEYPEGWDINNYTGTIDVIESFDGHSQVLEFHEFNDAGMDISQDNIDIYGYGNIEWWWQTNNTWVESKYNVYGSIGNIFRVRIFENDFWYHDGSWNQLSININNNTWYHLSIYFEFTDGGYQGLNQYDWKLFINRIEYGDFNMGSINDYIKEHYFFTDYGEDYLLYIDAIGITNIGLYNATYSFEDDIGGNPTDWTIRELGGNVDVIPLYNEHSSVVNIYDIINGEFSNLELNFVNEPFGTIEWWWNSNDTTYRSLNQVQGGDTSQALWYFQMDNDKFQYFNGTDWVNILSTTDNIWYHISLDFECTNNNYSGLSQYSWKVDIDYIEYGNYNFLNNEFYAKIIYFASGVADLDYMIYIDAVGFSWDDYYNIGDNINPLPSYIPGDNIFSLTEVIPGEYEVDEWIFHHNYTTRIQHPNGDDNPNGWSDWLDIPPVIDNVNTLALGWTSGGPDWGYQRSNVIDIEKGGGLSRNFYGLNDSNIYIEMSFSVNQITGGDVSANAVVFSIRDSDDISWVSYFRLKYDGTVFLYYNEAEHILGTVGIYNNFTISYHLNMDSQIQDFTLKYWDNNSIIYNILVPFYNSTAHDIDRVQYDHTQAGGIVESYLFNIIIYGDNGSYSDDIGVIQWNQITMEKLGFYYNTWYFSNYNLIDLYGNFEEVSLLIEALGGLIWNDFFNWTSINIYKFTNIYRSEYVSGSWANPKLLIRGNFIFNSISINGVKMTEGVNSYPLIMDSSNVDISESYFYVSNNMLYYTMTTDDDNLEYISAIFNIDNQNTFNYTMLWGGIKFYENLITEFRINYDDTTYFPYPYKTVLQYQNTILPQGLEIDNFQLLVTDNDNNVDNTITGYLMEIVLVYTVGAAMNIIITDYLSILTPIILITVITITIWQTTRKKVGTMLIVPTMVLMSFSVFAMGLIPIWLLFIMLLSSGVLIYSKWEEQFSMFSGFATMITAFLAYAGIIEFWLFYICFIIMVGYVIFATRKTIRG